MLPSTPLAIGFPEPAMLLVLLPVAADARRRSDAGLLTALQRQLEPAIRVLGVDEGSHPAVVRSFQPSELPALILVQQGVELWRQAGLSLNDALLPLLLSKIRLVDNQEQFNA